MAGYMIDTAEAIEELVGAGIPTKHARAIVHTVATRNDEVATKSDLQTLGTELKGDIQALRSGMQALESRLNTKIYLMAATVVGALKALEYLGI